MSIVPGATLAIVGGTGDGNETLISCPANQAVVGVVGRADANWPNQLALRCAPLNASGFPGAITTTVSHGGTGGTAFPAADCPYGTVATGARLGTDAGDWLSDIAYVCEAI
jgi:hypothetical protein